MDWTPQHTIEPDPRTIREGEGEYIGEYRANCAYCGHIISGDENGARHWVPRED